MYGGIDIYYGIGRGEYSAYKYKIDKNMDKNRPDKVANYLAMYFSFNPWEQGLVNEKFPGAVKMLRENGYKVAIGKSTDGNNQIVITTPQNKYFYSTYPDTTWVDKLLSLD